MVWFFGAFGQTGGVDLDGPAPAFVVERTDGESFELRQHRGEIVVLNFWASYCPPCRAEAPVLSRAHRLLGSRGLVLGLAVDRRSIPTAARLGMDYPQAVAPPELLTAYKVTMLPTTVVVAPDGQVVASFVGEITDSQITSAIEEATSNVTLRDTSGMPEQLAADLR